MSNVTRLNQIIKNKSYKNQEIEEQNIKNKSLLVYLFVKDKNEVKSKNKDKDKSENIDKCEENEGRKDVDKGDVLVIAFRVVGRGSGCERTSESGCDDY